MPFRQKMDFEEAQMRAIWAIREDDLPALKRMVEGHGVKLTERLKNGLCPAQELAVFKGGPVSDYVHERVAAENAALFGKGLGGGGISAPKKAGFTRRQAGHGP